PPRGAQGRPLLPIFADREEPSPGPPGRVLARTRVRRRAADRRADARRPGGDPQSRGVLRTRAGRVRRRLGGRAGRRSPGGGGRLDPGGQGPPGFADRAVATGEVDPLRPLRPPRTRRAVRLLPLPGALAPDL